MSTRPGVVLMGHGSRDAAGRAELRALAAALTCHPALASVPVTLGSLEFVGPDMPTIAAAFDACVAAGATRLAAVPLTLAAGGHGTNDLPAEVAAARARHQAMEISLAEMVGIDDALLACLVERANSAVASLAPLPPEQTALLLVSSGSASREANADVYKAARLLSDLTDGRLVEVAFLRLARPFLQDAIARCQLLGARRVVLLPLFLNTGLLVRRIPRKLVWLRRQFPNLELLDVPHFGCDPVLVEVIAARALAALTPAHQAPRVTTPVHLAPGHERSRTRWAVGEPDATDSQVLPTVEVPMRSIPIVGEPVRVGERAPHRDPVRGERMVSLTNHEPRTAEPVERDSPQLTKVPA